VALGLVSLREPRSLPLAVLIRQQKAWHAGSVRTQGAEDMTSLKLRIVSKAESSENGLETASASALPPVRVVRIIDRLNIGGPAKHVVWLSAGLSAERFETVLITGTVPPEEGDMSYFARAAALEPVVIKELSRELSLRDVIVIAKLVGQLWRLKPQIVHTHKAKAGAVGRIAAAIYKWATPSALWLRPRECRIIHTYHGHIFHSYYGKNKTRLFLAIERALARIATDCIIVISEQQRREISGRYGVGRPEQFKVIPLGIDFNEGDGHHFCLREELGVVEGELLVGSVGRLCEVKNYVMLLEAAALLLKAPMETSPRPRFVIVGDGHLRTELESLAGKLGVGDRVSFAGFRQDAASLYQDFDLVALTSLNEGTPVALIEAMNQGCAVVATEVGGVVDLMGARRETSDGFSIWEHGATAPSRDAVAFARALSYLIQRPDLRREMGERGRAFVRARLSKERLVQDVEELYRRVQYGERERPAVPSGA